MSFTSIGSRSRGNKNGHGGLSSNDIFSNAKHLLSSYQRTIQQLREAIPKFGTPQDNSNFRDGIALAIAQLSKTETDIRDEIDDLSAMDSSDQLTMSPELFRNYIRKLTSDFEKEREHHKEIVSEIATVQSSIPLRHDYSKNRYNHEEEEEEYKRSQNGFHNPPPQSQHSNQIQFVKEQEGVEVAIMREREEEITKINSNMRMVNEMVQDLAQVVEEHQEMVDHIERQAEDAHDKAHDGLEQVQKASELQPTCMIS